MGAEECVRRVIFNEKAELPTVRKFPREVATLAVVSHENYDDLYHWSVESYSDFWAEFWKFSGIIFSRTYDEVVDTSKGIADVPEWFKGSRLNYAENLLQHRENDRVALYIASESWWRDPGFPSWRF
ncbi:hypothetical protein P7K49_020566 [Saguinus oedipus]|uniref:Acetyl-coenzyme A synthetase N-terminal domain-containing protein n=1 Tax=Saguinus oedipus TaxID=9490 RepID=A0ABQ9V0M9_SAGOE|nr:hypothetical protein P7K49_020566 [Saguinus oedipus]